MPDEPEELCFPYCGGCGHRFFHSEKIAMSVAVEAAKTTRCHYCVEEAAEAARNPPKREIHEDDGQYGFDDEGFAW